MLSTRDVCVGLLLAAAVALSAAGCRTVVERDVPDISKPAAARVGLTESQRAEFYHLEEGSEVFPLAWFKALESESGSGLFAENMQRFGFLADAQSAQNADGLPVGITAAETRDLRFAGVKMIGVNCAACHVSEMTVNGKSVRLDGAGGRSDISAFYGALAKATIATATTPLKFLAFLKRLRSQEPNRFLSEPEANRARAAVEMLSDEGQARGESAFDKALEAELIKAIEEEMKRPPPDAPPLVLKPGVAQNRAADAIEKTVTRGLETQAMMRRLPRDDASSSTLASKVGASDVQRAAAALFSDVLATLRLLKARVAFVVTLAQSDVKTTAPGYGRIDAFGGARNLLFSKFGQPSTAPVSYPHLWNFERVAWLHWDANTTSVLERNIGQALGLGAVLDTSTFASTVSVVNLHRLEELAKAIKPPRWDEMVGPIDEAAAERGADLFVQHCARCHAATVETELDLNLIGTDPLRATNFAAPVGTTPNDIAIADLVGKVKRKAFDEKGFTAEERAILEGGRQPAWRVTSKYAVRPLISPWASAPYLHNNSVPALADLLLPPAQRPVEFFVGSSEYDVQKLGFVTAKQPGSFLFDTRLPGNSNAGHDYGTGLSAEDRARLLEYLKKF
jgi:mono/diheme cytochrome c family protein